MAQWLRALAVIEDLGAVPSNYMVPHNYLYPQNGLLWPMQTLAMYVVFII